MKIVPNFTHMDILLILLNLVILHDGKRNSPLMKIIPIVSPNTRTPHNGKTDWGAWSKWNDPPMKDNSSWRPQQRSYSHAKSYHQQSSQDHSHHSYRQAARLLRLHSSTPGPLQPSPLPTSIIKRPRNANPDPILMSSHAALRQSQLDI